MECLGQVVVLAPLRIRCAEEPQLVFLDWTTNVAADIGLSKTVSGGSGERIIFHIPDESLARTESENVAVDFITAALCDDIEDSAGRVPIFGAIGGGLDFNFLDKFKKQGGAASSKGRVRR